MNEEFGEWLRAKRKEKRLTLRALSSRANMAIGYLSLLENGKRKPKVDSLAPLATALDIPYGDILRTAGYLDDKNLLFAHRLRSIRMTQNIEINDLAEACGLSAKTILRWESGEGQLPSQMTLERLATRLQVTADYLCGITDHPNGKMLDLEYLLEAESVTYNGVQLTTEQKAFVSDIVRKVLRLSEKKDSKQNLKDDTDST